MTNVHFACAQFFYVKTVGDPTHELKKFGNENKGNHSVENYWIEN